MVSLTKIYVGLSGLSFISNRQIKPNYTINNRSSIKPANMFNPLVKISEIFEKETTHHKIPKELLDNLLYEIRTDPKVEFDSFLELRELDTEEKRDSFIRMLIFKWNSNKLDLNVHSLASFVRLVDYLKLPKEKVYGSLQQAYFSCIDRFSLDNLFVLKDIFRHTGKYHSIEDYHRLYSEQHIHASEALRLAKGALINDEFSRIIQGEITEKCLTDPPNYPKTYKEYKKFKETLISLSTVEYNFGKTANYRIRQLSNIIYKHVWEIEYYRNRKLPENLEYITKLLKVDEKYCQFVFDNMVNRHVKCIVADIIARVKTKPTEINRFIVHRKYYEEQLKLVRNDFKDFKNRYKVIFKRLEDKGVDLLKYKGEYKALGIIGGRMPYVNVKLLSPDDESLENQENIDFKEEYDEDRLPKLKDKEYMRKEMKALREGIKKVEQEMKKMMHMTRTEMKDFFFAKFPKAYKSSKRARKRRLKIKELNNPFFTRYDFEDWGITEEEYFNPKVEVKKEEKSVEEILSEFKTEYIKHLINIRHLEWQVESSHISPIKTLTNLYEAEEDTTRPEARKLDFYDFRFSKCFKMLDIFKKKNLNSEAEKYRQKVFEDTCDHKRVPSDRENLGDRYAFNDDPYIKVKDIPFLSTYLRTGGRMKVEMKIPLHGVQRSEKTAETLYHRLSISQPQPNYKCPNCEYYMFGGNTITKGDDVTDQTYYTRYKTAREFKCSNCGADISSFKPSYPTGVRGYIPAKYTKAIREPEILDEYGIPINL